MLYKYKISTTIYCGELEEHERVILSPLKRTFTKKLYFHTLSLVVGNKTKNHNRFNGL